MQYIDLIWIDALYSVCLLTFAKSIHLVMWSCRHGHAAMPELPYDQNDGRNGPVKARVHKRTGVCFQSIAPTRV